LTQGTSNFDVSMSRLTRKGGFQSRYRWAIACAWLASFAAAAQAPHVVKPGETLWRISREHLQTPARWPEIQLRNRVGEPRRLQPGTVLFFTDGHLVPEGSAVVAAVEGFAWRKREGEADRTLAPGMPVMPGDTLVTGADAFVTLALPSGSRTVLPSRSALEIMAIDAGTIKLRLIEGRVESQVQRQRPDQQFEIRVRSIGLGVRGTHFRVRDEGGLLTGEVIAGEVALHTGIAAAGRRPASTGEVVLRAGSGAVLVEDGTSEVRELLPAPQLAADADAAGELRSGGTLHLLPVSDARRYRLQIARDEQFLRPVQEQEAPSPSFMLPAALESGFYHLRLTAFDERGIEGLPGDTVVYLAQAGTDSLRNATASVMADGRVEIRWAGVAGRRYAFELSRSADFDVLLIDEPAIYAAGMIVGPFALAGLYHWRVREAGSAAEAAGAGGSFVIPAR
jgi:hypothetical protein